MADEPTLPRAEPYPDWLLYGGTPFHDPRNSAQKQMAVELARLGSRVLYAEITDSQGLREFAVGDGRIHLLALKRTPLLPMTVPGWNRRLNMLGNRPRLRSAADGLGFRGFIMLHYGWFSAELAGTIGQGLDILDCVDAEEERPKIVRVPGMKRYVIRTERSLLRKLDGLVVTSPDLLGRRCSDGLPCTVLPNGVDREAFPPDAPEPAALRDVPRPRAVLAGVLGPKIDLELVQRTMDRVPDLHLVVLGPVLRRIPGGLRTRRVHFLGELPYDKLGAHMVHCDVGLIPLTPTRYNRASCPLKALEYLAAGLPVVSVPNPAVEFLATRHPHLIFVAQRNRLGEAVTDALTVAGEPGFSVRARSAAAGHSWSRRAGDLLAFADSLKRHRGGASR